MKRREFLLGAAGLALALTSAMPRAEAQEKPDASTEQHCTWGAELVRDETGKLVLKVMEKCDDKGKAPEPPVKSTGQATASSAASAEGKVTTDKAPENSSE